jgi:hypothetical protein
MVICEGFNTILQQQQQQLQKQTDPVELYTNGTKPSSAPFPKPPPQPPARQFTLLSNGGSKVADTNGNHKPTNGHHNNNEEISTNNKKIPIPNKLPLTNTTTTSNYDNLRNIDSDDSRLTSPDVINNYLFNGNSTPKMPNSQSFTKPITTPTPPPPTSLTKPSLPITDKNIMNNIMNKCNIDPKSQSMMTTETTNNSIMATPKLQSDSVRSFKDKMQFFETCRENTTNKRNLFINILL